MLLRPLMDTLALVRERIKSFERDFTHNESQTRVSLVDPVLTVLGWDPQNPSSVKVEYPVRQRNRNTRADYALLASNQKPIAFVEAKSYGSDLGLAQDQLFEYGTGESVPYAIATNGANWAVYKRERQGADLLFKQLLDVSITDQPSTSIALKLLSLWRGLLTSQSSIDYIAPALGTIETTPLEPETARIRNPEIATGSSQPRLAPEHWKPEQPPQVSQDWRRVEMFTLSNPPDITGRKPAQLLLPGVQSIQINNWSSLLIEVTLWLIDSNKLNVELPWRCNSNSKRNILQATEIFSSKNTRIKQQREIKPGLFLLYNFNALDICDIAATLLDDCGVHSSETRVSLAPLVFRPGNNWT